MKNVLYIHGYHGSSHGSSFNNFKKSLNQLEFNLIGLDYDMSNANEAISEIENSIISNDIQIAIASSLGAFLLMGIKANVMKIIINPCLAPTIELLKISTGDIDIDSYKIIEDSMIEYESNKHIGDFDFSNVFGYFSTNDELFGEKYYEWWKMLTNKVINKIPGGHHISIDAANIISSKLIF